MSKPKFLPESAGEAFKHINAVTAPTLDDLKLMVYLEASGEIGYGDLARGAQHWSCDAAECEWPRGSRACPSRRQGNPNNLR